MFEFWVRTEDDDNSAFDDGTDQDNVRGGDNWRVQKNASWKNFAQDSTRMIRGITCSVIIYFSCAGPTQADFLLFFWNKNIRILITKYIKEIGKYTPSF